MKTTVLAVTNLNLTVNATVHRGAILYQTDAYSHWIDVREAEATPGTWVRYGSLLSAEWNRKQVKALVKCNAISLQGKEKMHFDLESIFDYDYTDEEGHAHKVYNILRMFKINTLEQVAIRTYGETPYSESLDKGVERVSIEKILGRVLPDPSLVDSLIAKAQEAIQL